MPFIETENIYFHILFIFLGGRVGSSENGVVRWHLV